jgi:hypothetical protein
VANRFLAAAEAMRRDGWWEPGALATDKAIKRRILREMLGQLLIPSRRDSTVWPPTQVPLPR